MSQLTGRVAPDSRLDPLRLVLGGVLLVLGVAIVVSPDATLFVVALLFGVQLLVAGLLRFMLALRINRSGVKRVIALGLAVLTTVAGVICVLKPATSLVILVLTVAVGWASDGVSDLVRSAGTSLPTTQRVALAGLGLVSVISAVAMVAFPGASLAVLAQLGGVLLLLMGIVTLSTALRPPR